MNTVIFLDIDGVLCTQRSVLAYDNPKSWDPTCCFMIRRLCLKYDCKIVISSTWKHDPSLSSYLTVHEFIPFMWQDFIDWKTPNSPGINDKRGDDIKLWLDKHPEVNQYVIIDDDSDMHTNQLPFLIKTKYDDGFSAKNYIDCEKLLKGEKRDVPLQICPLCEAEASRVMGFPWDQCLRCGHVYKPKEEYDVQ